MGSNRLKYPDGFWNDNKDVIIYKYQNGMSSNMIGEEYGCYGSTILNHLKEWGVEIRNNKSNRYNNKYYVNVNCFDDINNEDQAYWLGYIFSDGHITNNGHLMFGCHVQDIDILYKVKNFLSAENPIIFDIYNNPRLTINSRYICDKLKNMGFTHNKSWVVDFNKIKNNIPNNLLHHFIRGMFDGDGSIRYYNYDYVKGYQYHFGYTGLYEVCKFIADYLHINSKIIKERDTNTYTIRTTNAPLIKYIYSVLYKDSTIYCDRKYNTYNKVLELIKQENKDKVRGVCWYKNSNQWIAQCHVNKNNITIGYFDNKYDAEYARLKYEYDNFGNESPQWYLFKDYGIGDTNDGN